MKNADDIKELFEKSGFNFNPAKDLEIQQKVLDSYEKHKPAQTVQIWRIIMRSPITKLAAAVVIIAAALIFINQLSDGFGKEAYAVEQTIKAIDAISTVHFKADFFKQGYTECWMKFDGRNAKPTYMCLFAPGSPLRKVDTPKGNFAYNTATNRIYKTFRDERNKGWYIDFAGFFRQMLNNAKSNKSIVISNENDPQTQQEIIVINMDEGDRKCRFVVDPKTKLPLSLETIEVKDIMKYLRQTIAVRNINFIEYNQTVPEGIFDVLIMQKKSITSTI